MTYKETHRDLFSIDFKKYTPAHCISSDCAMGAGIAIPMAKKFKLRGLQFLDKEILKHPACVYHNGVYNLITKKRAYHKPTLESLLEALSLMRVHVEKNGIKHIVMPKIGSGLDRLPWPKIREKMKIIFENTDVEILVCYI